MKQILLVLAIVAAAALGTLYAMQNPGYVLITRPPWSVEMSLMLFVPLLFLLFGVIYFLLYLAVRLVRIPRDVTRWRSRRQTREGRRALEQGLIKLAEGNWLEAEAELLANMRYSETPLINYLGAACAAQAQDNIEKRDEYLALAQNSAPQNRLAISMIQAYMQSLASQSEQALATLTDLRASAPRHRPALAMLAQSYLALRDWTGLIDLIPDLRHLNVMPSAEIDALELRAHKELLMLSLPSGSNEILRKAWGTVPKALRRDAGTIAVYARQLIEQEDMDEAESVLRDAIEAQWSDELVSLYGRARARSAVAQLETVQGWLGAHADNPVLLLAAGRIAARNDQGRAAAKSYFERCMALYGPIEAYFELAKLHELNGETAQALAVYRRGWEAYVASQRGQPPRRRFSPSIPKKLAG